jgi:hypothetical protein
MGWGYATHWFIASEGKQLCSKPIRLPRGNGRTTRPCGQPREGSRHRSYDCPSGCSERFYSLESRERHVGEKHRARQRNSIPPSHHRSGLRSMQGVAPQPMPVSVGNDGHSPSPAPDHRSRTSVEQGQQEVREIGGLINGD